MPIYVAALAVLLLALAVAYLARAVGLDRAKQELIDSLSAQVREMRQQLDDSHKELAHAQAGLSAYHAQVVTLLMFIEQAGVALSPEVVAIARAINQAA